MTTVRHHTHLARAVAILVAALLPAGLHAEEPTALRAQVEAVLQTQPAVAASLPAHPMAPALLAACTKVIAQPDQTSALKSLATTLGDAPIGIYALETLITQESSNDSLAFCMTLCVRSPMLRVSLCALDYLVPVAPDPQAALQDFIDSDPTTRLSAHARVRLAQLLRAEQPWESSALLLEAWRVAPDSMAAAIAPEARELLGACGQTIDLALLGGATPALPVPGALLARRAEALRQTTLIPDLQTYWRTGKDAWHPVRETHAADYALGAFFHARAAQADAKGQLPKLRTADADREAALAAFEAVQGDLPADERAYALLLLADACARDFQSPRARALLNALPEGDALSAAYREAAAALRARLAEETTTPQGAR